MPRILFTETRIVRDEHRGTERETRYEAGKVYDLPPASCRHWKTRGVAVDAPQIGEPAPEPGAPAADVMMEPNSDAPAVVGTTAEGEIATPAEPPVDMPSAGANRPTKFKRR